MTIPVAQRIVSQQPGGVDAGSMYSGGLRLFRNLLLFLTLAFYLISPVLAAGQAEVEEYRLKAAFLFHFAQLVEWPPKALTSGDGSLIFCVYGEDPFHGDLEGTVQGKSVAAKPVRIRHINQPQDSKGCHLVFMDRNESGRVRELLNAVNSMPVLTVGESENFLKEGGMIRFCMEERKVRFEISQEAAEKANLKVSSRLLLLAKNVIRANGER